MTVFGVGGSARDAALAAAVFAGGFVVAATELLGLAGAIRFGPLLLVWLVAGGLVWACRRRLRIGWVRPARPDAAERLLLGVLTAIVGVTGFTAIACPPNNWDVVLYHLPRQVQWLQQGSVAHFPTQDYRLTVNPPFAELVGLHLLALTGTDRLTGVVSWASMLLALVAVSVLARDAGLPRKGQLLAAVFAATVPVGVHEAANGKNDWLVAAWLSIAVGQSLRAWRADRLRPIDGVLVGLTLGLLVLTKGTGGVFAVPVVLVGAAAVLVRRPPGSVTAVAVAGLVAAGVNAGHWHRNLSAYGSVGGQTFGLGNETTSAGAIGSNAVRNAAMHLAMPREEWNAAVERAVLDIHRWLGRPADDPATTWGGGPFRVEYAPRKEDFATAQVHAVILLGLAGFLPRAGRVGLVAGIAAAGAVLFCVAFKWQPWHPRLHLPLFALAGVGFGWAFTRPGARWLAPLAVGGLVWAAVPAAVRSESRPLLGSQRITRLSADVVRFQGNAEAAAAAAEVVRRLNGASSVDLVNHPPSPWEYPLTVLLRRTSAPPRVGYFYPVAGSPPGGPADAVIDIGTPVPPDLIRHPRTRVVYRQAERVGPFTVYRPVRPGDEWERSGLTADHPVGRFGIGPEPPATDD